MYIYEDWRDPSHPMISDYLSHPELKQMLEEKTFRGKTGIIQKFHEPIFDNECKNPIFELIPRHCTGLVDPKSLSNGDKKKYQ